MLIAVAIAAVAAYFSVYGLAHIFAATFWSVVLMGGVLEVGKLVATSFVYRYWAVLNLALKAYLLIAILGLMVLTSAGIFGYLSNAYQQDTVGVKDIGARIELLRDESATLSKREQAINDDIARIGSNYVSARQSMIKQYSAEKNQITSRLVVIRAEQLELSSKQLEVEAHTGPIIYIAKAMNRGIDDAVMWMICLIIFVFDPLAVALTIGANIALSNNTKPKQSVHTESHDDLLDSELMHKQDMIETLAADNQRLEEELFALADAFERKELQLQQTRDAVRALDPISNKPPSIADRLALHSHNQVSSKITP